MAVAVPQPTVSAAPKSRKKSFERRDRFIAWYWIGPAAVFGAVFLVYPVLNTIWTSFQHVSLARNSSDTFVGLKNYQTIFTNPDMLEVLRNNLLWLVLATGGTVFLGLIFAVLVDRVRIESFAKAAIFIPMALSMTAAAVIWRFVYVYAPPGQTQIGVLNAIWTSFGAQPVGWAQDPKNALLNNIMLIIAYVWMWTGFCMVILSAALKSIPTEVLEAARVDGASELSIFFRITLPMVSPTVAVVATTMVINVLKIYDLVYVMTGGLEGTNVIAVQYRKELFDNIDHIGLANALAVVLLIAIIPVMIFNIRRFRVQEAQR